MTRAASHVWGATQILPPISAQVLPGILTGASVVGTGVPPDDTMVQVPAQQRSESEDWTMLPEQVSSERQMWPPKAEQVRETCASGVCTGRVVPGVTPGEVGEGIYSGGTAVTVLVAVVVAGAVVAVVDAAVVAAGAVVVFGTTQVPSQHRDESDDFTSVPSQTCPDGQMVPPNASQLSGTCFSGVCSTTGPVPGVVVGAGGVAGCRNVHPAASTQTVMMSAQAPMTHGA